MAALLFSLFFLFVRQATASPVASKSSITWDSGSVLKAGIMAHLTATLRDSSGNALPVDQSADNYSNYLSFAYADSSGHGITGATPVVQLLKVTTIGIQQITMTWTKLGTYSLLVKVSGEEISGSPFQFYVTPGPVHYPSSTGAWLNDVHSFPIDSLATLCVFLVDAYGNNVTLSGGDSTLIGKQLSNLAVGFNGVTDFTSTVFQQTLGDGNTELVTFNTQLAGSLKLQVANTAMPTEFLSNSPFNLSIAVGPISVVNSIGNWFPDRVAVVQAGQQARFIVSQRDKYGNIACPATGSNQTLKLFGSVYGESGLNISSKTNQTSGETTYMFTLFRAKKYSFNLQDSLGSVLGGLPQDLVVVPGPVSYPSCSASFVVVVATPSGVPVFSAGLIASVQIHLMDAYGNEVSTLSGATMLDGDFNNVTLTNGASGILNSLKSEAADGSGYQMLTFIPLKAGPTIYQMHIGHNLEKVSNSPLSFSISVGELSPRSCTASWQLGNSQSGKVGQPVTVRVYMMDCCGNNLTTATGFYLYPQFNVALDATEQSGSDAFPKGIDGSITSNNGDGFTDLTFVPIFAGVANVHVYVVAYSASTEVKNSPLSISLEAGGVMMQMCYAYWPSGQVFRANSTAHLTVVQLDQYENVVCPNTFRSDKAQFNGTVYHMSDLSISTPLAGVTVTVAGPTSGTYNATWLLTEASAGYSVSITGLVQAGTTVATYYPIQAIETDLTFSILPGTPDVKHSVVRLGSNFGDPLPSSCPLKIVHAGFIDKVSVELRDGHSNIIASIQGSKDAFTFLKFSLAVLNGSTDITARGLTSVENIPNPDGSSLQAINFLPMVAGLFNLHISGANGETPVCGTMQLKIMAGALSVSHSIGSWQSGTSTVQAGATLTLMVLLRDVYNNSFTADFRDEGSVWNKNFRFSVVKVLKYQDAIANVLQSDVDPDGFSPIAFSPTRAGQLQLEVGNSDEDEVIVGSPFNFTVTAGDASVQSCIGSWLGGTNTFQAGTKITFAVLMKDMFGNTLNSENGASDFATLTMSVLVGAGSKVIPYSEGSISKDKSTGYQYLSFEMQMMGQFLLQVVSGSQTLMGSPFPFTIVVGRPMVTRCTGSWLNQVNTFQAGYSTATLIVQLVDSFGNAVTQANGGIPLFLFTVGVVGQSSINAVLANLTQVPGQQITFVPLQEGSFQLRVGSKDSIVGSPFSFIVVPGPLSIPSCIAAWKNNINSFTSGQQTNLSLQLMDAAGNALTTFTGRIDNLHVAPNLGVPNAIQDVEVSAAQSGYVYISFKTSTAAQGILLRVGTIVGGSWQFQVSNSPISFNVEPGPAQASASTGAWRSGMNQYQRPALAQFVITRRDAAGNPVYTKKGQPLLALQATLTVVNSRRMVTMVNQSWTMFPDQPSAPSQLLVFRPGDDGSFLLSVFDNSGAILGGPFLMWYFSGNVAPSKCTLAGPGLSDSTAGTHTSFLVQLSDVNGNNPQEVTQLSTIGGLTAVLLMHNSSYELPISIARDPDPAGGALYTASYTPYIAGIYEILVYYAGVLLKSNLTKSVFPGPLDAAHCSAQGPALLSPQKPGNSLTFSVYVYDSQANNVPHSTIQVVLVPANGTNVSSIDIDAIGVAKVTLSVTKAPLSYLIYVLVAPSAAYHASSDESMALVMKETSIFLQNVQGSPYSMVVQAGTPNASLSSASGNGLNGHASLNEWNPIIVTLLDSYGNPASGYSSMLALGITGAGNFESSGFEDQGNGQYISQFKPLETGGYQIAISLQGIALHGSPWNTTVVDTLLPRAANDTATTLDGLPISIKVTENDKVFFGTIAVTAVQMAPKNGYVTITKNNLLYTPNYQFYGTDLMSYTIEDGYHRTDSAFVIVKIDIRPPHFVSMPFELAAFEGIVLPRYGGIDGISIAYSRPDVVIYSQVSSSSGSVYLTSPVSDGSLSLAGTVTTVNSSLQNVHYIGETYFNGNDTITFTLSDGQGISDIQTVTVMVQAVNDPPFVSAPSILEVRSLWVNFGGATIPGIVVGDPDERDVRADSSALDLVVLLQLTGGLLKASLPLLYRRDIVLMDKSDKVWKSRSEEPGDKDPVSVKGLGIRFTAPVDVCNSILSQLIFAKDDLNISTNSVNLLVSVNDMGNFGCYQTCDSNKTVPLLTTMTIEVELLDWLTKLENLWAETLRATRRILGSTGGSVSAACLVLFAIMLQLGRKAHAERKAARYDDVEELNQELLCEQSRIFNPMWIPSAAGDPDFRVSSTPNPLQLQLRKLEFRKRLSKVNKEVEKQVLSGFKTTPDALDESSQPLISQSDPSNSGEIPPGEARKSRWKQKY